MITISNIKKAGFQSPQSTFSATPLEDSRTLLIRRSPLGGVHSAVLGMSYTDFRACYDQYQDGSAIQDAFSELDADAREFIMTGITPAQWEAAFAL